MIDVLSRVQRGREKSGTECVTGGETMSCALVGGKKED